MKLPAATILLLLLLSFSKVLAQPYYFRHHQVEDGLSYNSVLCTIQDQRGFMWFGTRDGLNRFDGYHFKSFKNDAADQHSLGNNHVYSLAQDQQDRIWVGTKAGLYLYEARSGHFQLEAQTLNKVISEIVIDDRGNVWFLASGKLSCINSKKGFRTLELNTNFSAMAKGSSDELWLATEEGFVLRYQPSNGSLKYFDTFSKTPHISARRIEKIWKSNTNELYVGTSNHGVKVLDVSNGSYQDILTFDEDRTEILARAFCRGDDNQIWIGTESGIYIYDPASKNIRNLKKNFFDPFSLSDNAVYSICSDREGGIWIGTYFGGVNYYSSASTRFEKFFPRVSPGALRGNLVREFCMDTKGYLWVGTEDAGLNRLDLSSNTFRHVGFSGKKGSIAYNNVHGLMSTGNELWVGTYQHGLDILDINTLQVIRHYGYGSGANDLKTNFVNVIYKTKAGTIYLGTQVGLYRYNPAGDNFSYIAAPGVIYISCIREDHLGRLWIGTFGNGAYVLSADQKSWTRFENNGRKDALTSNVVTDIFEDSRHRIWMCTENGGLCEYLPKSASFSNYPLPAELRDKYLFNIVEDLKGRLWITSSGGLICIDPPGPQLRLYSKADGLLNDQFNYRSAFKDASGRLYFGSSKGFVRHDPQHQVKTDSSTPLYITSLQLEQKGKDSYTTLDLPELLFKDHITLGPGNTSFSIDAAALSYTTPGTTSYRYKMEGLDQHWTTLPLNRRIYYTEVPAGDYTFKIQAMVGDDHVFSASRELKITIRPTFLASQPALVLYFLLLVFTLYLLWRYLHQRTIARNQQRIDFLHSQKEREIYEAKIDFFTHVTHEIRTPLSLIKAPLEKVLEAEEIGPFRKDLLLVERNTDRLLDLVDQLLSFRKTETDGYRLNFNRTNITALSANLCSSFQVAAHRHQIGLTTHLANGLFAYVDQDAFHKILSNLLNNAVKYADTKVEVSLYQNNDQDFIIEVRNDGETLPNDMAKRIFEPFIRAETHKNKPGTGIGLPLAKALAELHQGIIEYRITEQLNTFVLRLPFHQSLEMNICSNDQAEEQGSTEEQLAELNIKPVILIVEDQRELREFICSLLDEEYEVLSAPDAAQGKEMLLKHSVKLIVSDVMMPGIDGFEFCRQLKDDINYSHIPFILLTAKDTFASKIEGLDCGSDAYIEKPFSSKYLKLQIVNLLNNRDKVKAHYAATPSVPLQVIAHSSADALFLDKLDTLIKGSVSRPEFDIDWLAEEMNMSRPTLYRKVKAITDLSPVELVTLTRLKQAAVMLQQGDFKVYQIAEQVGFTSSAVLGRAFQKQFGMSPSAYAAMRHAAPAH